MFPIKLAVKSLSQQHRANSVSHLAYGQPMSHAVTGCPEVRCLSEMYDTATGDLHADIPTRGVDDLDSSMEIHRIIVMSTKVMMTLSVTIMMVTTVLQTREIGGNKVYS